MTGLPFPRRHCRTTISDMRKEDLYSEQYEEGDQYSIADAPLWERQQLPVPRLNAQYRNPHLDSMRAKALLGDYFRAGRLPPAEVVAAVRHQSWRDLEYKGGSLDVVGDRLYVLAFRSMYAKLSYVKIGRTKKKDRAQVRERIMRHEGEAKIAQAVLFDAWISCPCESAVDWEKGVKNHLGAAAEEVDLLVEGVKAEYFRGISFSDVVRVVNMQKELRKIDFLETGDA